jgi:hypothetical protein
MFQFQIKKSIDELRRSSYHPQLGRNLCAGWIAQQQGIRLDTAFKKIEQPMGDLWLVIAEFVRQECLKEPSSKPSVVTSTDAEGIVH